MQVSRPFKKYQRKSPSSIESSWWISSGSCSSSHAPLTGFMCAASFSLLSSRTSLSILSMPRSLRAFCPLVRPVNQPPYRVMDGLLRDTSRTARTWVCTRPTWQYRARTLSSRKHAGMIRHTICRTPGRTLAVPLEEAVVVASALALDHDLVASPPSLRSKTYSLTSLHSGARDADMVDSLSGQANAAVRRCGDAGGQ